jgi:hypothetical protein
MAMAPEPFLSACLEVLYAAALEARLIGYAGSQNGLSVEDSNRLADLADAVHNIPDLLRSWEDVDEGLLRAMLADFDRKWGEKSTLRLLVAYERQLGAA